LHPKTGSQRNTNDRRNGIADEPLLVDWETLDRAVWSVVRALKLLPSEVLDASLSISFDQHGAVQPTHSIGCSQLCDPHLNLQKPEPPHSSVVAEVSASLPSAEDYGSGPHVLADS